MGMVYAKLKLLNAGDIVLFKRGMLEEDRIRQVEVEALVDSGTTMIVLPKSLCEQLGLDYVEKRDVELADGKAQKAEIVGPIEIRFDGRLSVTNAVVLGNEVLLGSIPMEEMDVVVDPKRQRLIVNPEHPDLPRLKVKLVRS